MRELAADLLGGKALTQYVLNQGKPKAFRKQFTPLPTGYPAMLFGV